jgi:hypothetical protein
MALVSPGVQVSITDESQYLPAPTNSVPFVLLATAQDKLNPAGTGIASGTTAANANKLFRVTSQRDLVNLYGNPFFYTTTDGTPIQGYELNEYGLLAAYSALGATNTVYCMRADIDLASLVGQTGRPSGNPAAGTLWLNTSETTWGIYVFNKTTSQFTLQTPIVITDSADVSSGSPVNTLGNIGDYAVIAIPTYSAPTSATAKQFFYKSTDNTWVNIGSNGWLQDVPAIQGSNAPTSLTAADTFILRLNGQTQVDTTITVPAATSNTVTGVANLINALGWAGVSAAVVGGKLNIYSSQPGNTNSSPAYITIVAGTGTVLTDLGITAGNYNQPQLYYGTSSQQPLWQTGQTNPRPTGSIWIKVGSVGNGLTPIIEEWSDVTSNWDTRTVTLATSDAVATSDLDSTGGSAIPVGTLYAQYDYNAQYAQAPIYYWQKATTGATVVTGTVNNPTFTNGPYTFSARISVPGTAGLQGGSYSITLANSYTLSGVQITGTAGQFSCTAASQPLVIGRSIVISGTLGGTGTITGYSNPTTYYIIATNGTTTFTLSTSSGGAAITTTAGTPTGLTYTVNTYTADAEDFIEAWTTAAIPYTTIGTSTTGALVITHTAGGVISISDPDQTGVMTEAGFIVGTTDYVKDGLLSGITYTTSQSTTTGSGINLEITVLLTNGFYVPVTTAFVNAGTSYAVGDQVTFLGTDLGGASPANNLVVEITQVNAGVVEGITLVSGTPNVVFTTLLSPWVEADITASATALTEAPANGTNWFYSVVNQVDIMVNYGGGWKGYINQSYDANGFPTPTGAIATDPNGPIVSASAPTLQSDGTALVYGDLWIDTSDLENYPIINRWQQVDGTDQWVRIDNTDQVNPDGVLFADARWATSGTTNPATDDVPTIVSLLTSNYLDLDAPESSLYPTGMLLFNTRRSGYNVKEFRTNYFNSTSFPDEVLPTAKDAWVSISGLQSNGAPYMGRKAQRAVVVSALRAAIDTNTAIRDEDNFFNLMATPNYPELQPNMITLNADRGETGFIIGDTPLRLPETATAIQAWATNAAGATSTGDDGLVTRSTYMGLFYPSGLTNDLSGNEVVVPASHMMIRTLLRNDSVAYPWFAPAGVRRGVIDNAASIGYLDAQTGEFVPTKTRVGIRDVLYTNFINPLVFFTGNGLLNYGNKSSFDSQSALDRINVARLVAYIRRQLTLAARPFVFEPNDALTRQQITSVIQTLFVDLVAKRGVYDYLVVCDDSNNTPARIDRNELWVDVAIEPVKAAEFIYIPVRILNTGELSGQ